MGNILAAWQPLRMSRRSWAGVMDFKTRVLRLKPEVQILGSSKSIRHTTLPPPSPRYESRNLIHLKSCFLRNKETKLNANLWQAFSTDYYSVGVRDIFTWFNAFGSTPVLRGRYKNQGHLVLKFPTTCMSLWNSSCLLTPQNREKKQIARLEVRSPFKIHHYIVCLACLPKH